MIDLTAIPVLLICCAVALAVGALWQEWRIHRLLRYVHGLKEGWRDEIPRLAYGQLGLLGEELHQMRRMFEKRGSIERFVHALTHEVKSPLAAIQGAVELLGEELPPERRARFLQNIGSEAARIQMIVEKLLVLSALEARGEIERPEEFTLFGLVGECGESLAPLIERKKIALKISGDREALMWGDRFFVRQAVENLLQNAVDFSPVGGAITAAVQRHAAFVELSVYDHGPGIPPYAREKIFDRFYSLKRPDSGRKSSGLGLSLVREVALLHRGRVEIKNGESGGAVAILAFPRRDR